MFFIGELITVVILLLFIFWWLNNMTKVGKFYNTIRGPPTIPLLGNALALTSTTKLLENILIFNKQYGGIFKVSVGPVYKYFVVTDYKFLENVLSSMKLLNKSPEYTNMRPWLGDGLLTSTSKIWKKHRKIITPSFHFKILEDFIEIFDSKANIMLEKFNSIANKESVDVYSYIKLCTLDIICESSMGTAVDAQNNPNSNYVNSLEEMCRIIVERSVSPIGIYEFLFRFTANYRSQTKALKYLHNFTNEVIEKRRKEFKQTIISDDSKNGDIANDIGIKKRKVFLDCLLEAEVDGRPLTNQEIREEVDTFMFEGHDTVTSAISFSLYCLAHNPDIQEKVLKEQKELFGDDLENCVSSYTNLNEMKYLDQVIKETLRLYPSVPMILRETDRDIEINGMMVPKGITILMFVYGIHRNPDFFPDPETFNPSRFDEIDGKHPYAYVPFSAGPRNCIGQKFAVLEMKCAISKVIRNFQLFPARPEHELKIASEMVLKSTSGIKVGMRKR